MPARPRDPRTLNHQPLRAAIRSEVPLAWPPSPESLDAVRAMLDEVRDGLLQGFADYERDAKHTISADDHEQFRVVRDRVESLRLSVISALADAVRANPDDLGMAG